ncbi:MAG: AbiJ-NTD4 domain-containing protein [Candidatus Tectimicrobiota bacterium]
MQYFSDKERGPNPRTEDVVSPTAWGGIVALINALVSTGSFGHQFPDLCPDGPVPVGTDEAQFSLAIQAEIPGLSWPLVTISGESWDRKPYAPDTFMILDLIQFCYRCVAKPIQRFLHSYFQHYHLLYDVEGGRGEFLARINTIFSRNRISYNLQEDGSIIRIAPAILHEMLTDTIFRSGDSTLDHMLEDARTKFLNTDPLVRREAVERLWDCWERIKTLENPDNKRISITRLLDKAASEPQIRQILEEEANTLTTIGNSFHIRHTEVNQTRISESDHIDYLFHRLFAVIQLLLKKL